MPYQLTTAIRYEPDSDEPFYLLHFHYDRLVDACLQHGWDQARLAVSYDALNSACCSAVHDRSQSYKVLRLMHLTAFAH